LIVCWNFESQEKSTFKKNKSGKSYLRCSDQHLKTDSENPILKLEQVNLQT